MGAPPPDVVVPYHLRYTRSLHSPALPVQEQPDLAISVAHPCFCDLTSAHAQRRPRILLAAITIRPTVLARDSASPALADPVAFGQIVQRALEFFPEHALQHQIGCNALQSCSLPLSSAAGSDRSPGHYISSYAGRRSVPIRLPRGSVRQSVFPVSVLQVVVAGAVAGEASSEERLRRNLLSSERRRGAVKHARARIIKYRRVFCRLLGAAERDTTIRGDIPKGRPLCCERLALRCLDTAGGTPTKLLLYLAGVILSESL